MRYEVAEAQKTLHKKQCFKYFSPEKLTQTANLTQITLIEYNKSKGGL